MPLLPKGEKVDIILCKLILVSSPQQNQSTFLTMESCPCVIMEEQSKDVRCKKKKSMWLIIHIFIPNVRARPVVTRIILLFICDAICV